ncbi:MAG: chorismate synthase, partial [Myxococcales bacterium]|nr:chorismate synthase [Myxococcales bacterium]
GGGAFSGRLTAALVAAGTVAKRALDSMIEPRVTFSAQLFGEEALDSRLAEAIQAGDSIGGIVEGRIERLPAALGEPFFDSLEGLLAHALFAIPGVKGVEFGLGFEFARRMGVECRDAIESVDGALRHNHSGGIDGGLSNSNPIVFRIAVKPAVSFGALETVNLKTGARQILEPNGRHDACFARRLPVVVEAVCALVVIDLFRLSGRMGEAVVEE